MFYIKVNHNFLLCNTAASQNDLENRPRDERELIDGKNLGSKSFGTIPLKIICGGNLQKNSMNCWMSYTSTQRSILKETVWRIRRRYLFVCSTVLAAFTNKKKINWKQVLLH